MIEAKNFTLPGLEEDGGLINAMVRYRPESPATEVSATPFERPRVQLSLVLLHGISSREFFVCFRLHRGSSYLAEMFARPGDKETWLPTIEHLFQLQQAAPTNVFTIVEAWSLDGPNHGHAGIMNQHKLAGRIPGAQAARAILVFLNSGLVAAGSTVVAIGHSAGACIMVQSTDDYPVNQLPFASLIMVDPPMLTPETLSIALRESWPLIRAIDIARKRKDVWPSRAAAREWLAKRWPWSRWDPRVLDLYVEHALCDLPTPSHPDLKEGVTLSTTREQEAWGYSGHDDAHASLERLKDLCPAIPVHCIFGGQIDMVPLEGQAAIVDEAAGRRMRSIVRVAQSGHLIVQENPRDLALALWGILHEDYGQPSARAAVAARL